MSKYDVLTNQSVQTDPVREFAIDVLVGLSENPKRLNSRWFYDDKGSELFRRIMELEEYYPTDKEAEVFRTHGADILSQIADDAVNVIDLGAGDGRKTSLLLEPLAKTSAEVHYIPIDISEAAIADVTTTMKERFPDVTVNGLVSDYVTGLRWLSQSSERRNFVLFLGSNIGNFNKAQARGFLRQLWDALNPNDMVLIGFDLKKDIDVLLDAYNDAEGVTSEFNLNLLHRINRELGADFDVDNFRHYGTYNTVSGAMESYLVSRTHQTVRIDALRANFEFLPWEPIHTEYSYKYLPSDMDSLAAYTGFEVLAQYHDEKKWFCDAVWRVKKDAE